jgi:hypothetical protein
VKRRIAGVRRTCVSAGAALASLCVLAGCGGTNLSTHFALASMEKAGFHGLVVQQDAGEDEDIDVITPSSGPWFWKPVKLVRYVSSAKAKEAYKNGYSRKRFVAYWSSHPKTCPECAPLRPPRGFEARKVLSFRICNVILFSYNARLDRRLTAKVNRAAALLRNECH